MNFDMNKVVGSHDLVWLVLDSLRHDVAVAEFEANRIPNLCLMLPGGWTERHSPGNFTYAALQSFFAGFLPTPAAKGRAGHERLFAVRFEGSVSTGARTKVFDEPTVIQGFAAQGYRTVCVGGVGFFNPATPLSQAFSGLFEESHWLPEFGVVERESARHQFAFAAQRVRSLAQTDKMLLFVNVSAIHQPNYFYDRGAGPDDLASHAAALRYVDSQLPILLQALEERARPVFFIVCSDHGTAYGEEGWFGHRLSHPAVWTVPYAEGVLGRGGR